MILTLLLLLITLVPTSLMLVALFQKMEWRQEMKCHARSKFQNHSWGKFALIYTIIWMLIGIIVSFLRVIPFFNILFNMTVTGLISYGSVDVLRKICQGEDFVISDFFPIQQLSSMIALTFVKEVYLFLWTLLFIIPGIIKGYSYSQIYYIANENPGMSIDEVITQSREMMDGHKWELFILQSSFMGWGILAVLTFGIIGIYILPLYFMSLYLFHDYVKKAYVESSTPDHEYHIY